MNTTSHFSFIFCGKKKRQSLKYHKTIHIMVIIHVWHTWLKVSSRVDVKVPPFKSVMSRLDPAFEKCMLKVDTFLCILDNPNHFPNFNLIPLTCCVISPSPDMKSQFWQKAGSLQDPPSALEHMKMMKMAKDCLFPHGQSMPINFHWIKRLFSAFTIMTLVSSSRRH